MMASCYFPRLLFGLVCIAVIGCGVDGSRLSPSDPRQSYLKSINHSKSKSQPSFPSVRGNRGKDDAPNQIPDKTISERHKDFRVTEATYTDTLQFVGAPPSILYQSGPPLVFTVSYYTPADDHMVVFDILNPTLVPVAEYGSTHYDVPVGTGTVTGSVSLWSTPSLGTGCYLNYWTVQKSIFEHDSTTAWLSRSSILYQQPLTVVNSIPTTPSPSITTLPPTSQTPVTHASPSTTPSSSPTSSPPSTTPSAVSSSPTTSVAPTTTVSPTISVRPTSATSVAPTVSRSNPPPSSFPITADQCFLNYTSTLNPQVSLRRLSTGVAFISMDPLTNRTSFQNNTSDSIFHPSDAILVLANYYNCTGAIAANITITNIPLYDVNLTSIWFLSIIFINGSAVFSLPSDLRDGNYTLTASNNSSSLVLLSEFTVQSIPNTSLYISLYSGTINMQMTYNSTTTSIAQLPGVADTLVVSTSVPRLSTDLSTSISPQVGLVFVNGSFDSILVNGQRLGVAPNTTSRGNRRLLQESGTGCATIVPVYSTSEGGEVRSRSPTCNRIQNTANRACNFVLTNQRLIREILPVICIFAFEAFGACVVLAEEAMGEIVPVCNLYTTLQTGVQYETGVDLCTAVFPQYTPPPANSPELPTSVSTDVQAPCATNIQAPVDETNYQCCHRTRNCPGETGHQCGAACCCCPSYQACCADSSGCCYVG